MPFRLIAEAQIDFHLKRFNEVSVSMASKPENNIDLVISSTTKATTKPIKPTLTMPTTIATTTFKKSSDNRVNNDMDIQIAYICNK